MQPVLQQTWSNFPALELVRTGRVIRTVGKVTLWTLVVCIFAMFLLPWRQTATGTGTVVALDPQQRPQPVKSAVKGVVKYVKPGLREGSYVEKGEILLELEPAAEGGVQQLEIQIAAVQLKEEAARSRIAFAQQQIELQERSGEFLAESLTEELKAANRKLEQARKEEAALQAELEDFENQKRIAEEVFQEGIISREELVTKQQKWATQKEKVAKAQQAVEEAVANVEAKKQLIDSKLEEIEFKNRSAYNKKLEEEEKLQTILKELSVLRVKREEMERLNIPAPRSGYIQQWFGLEGSDTVKEGEQLFVIVPEAEDLAVELMVNGNDMPLIHVGDKVRLQFEGWPAVQFVGWPSVAIGSFGGKVNRVFPTDDGKGNFRVLVTPDNHFEREDGWPTGSYMRQGIRANGWVLLERVPLGYEIWRQLNGFPPALTEDPMKDKGTKVKLPKP